MGGPSVHDQGDPIPLTLQPLLFDAFKRGTKGTGSGHRAADRKGARVREKVRVSGLLDVRRFSPKCGRVSEGQSAAAVVASRESTRSVQETRIAAPSATSTGVESGIGVCPHVDSMGARRESRPRSGCSLRRRKACARRSGRSPRASRTRVPARARRFRQPASAFDMVGNLTPSEQRSRQSRRRADTAIATNRAPRRTNGRNRGASGSVIGAPPCVREPRRASPPQAPFGSRRGRGLAGRPACSRGSR